MFELLKLDIDPNIRRFYLASFLEAMWFPNAVWILFFLASGLRLEQIGILISAIFFTQFIFEIPSSVWADRYSRKNILVIGMVFSFISDLVFFFGNSFYYFLIAAFFIGLSGAFRSGTDSALVYDTLVNIKREKEYGKIQSNINGIYFLGRAVSVIIGPLAYVYDHKFPFLLAAISSILTIFVLSLIKEPAYHKSSGAHFDQIKEGLKILLKNEKVWLIIFGFSLMSAASDILFTNYQPVLEFAGLPVVYFSLVYLGVNIFSFIGSMSYAKLAEKLSPNKILAFYLLAAIMVSLSFASGNLILILPFILLLSFSFGSHNAYITSLINALVPSSHRATAISIQSQINMLMLGVAVVVINKISNDYSIFWGMISNALLVSLAFVIFLSVKINNGKYNKLKTNQL